ncbi:MAG TPA: radical SAM protein [Candidatus Dormibacteraeota bacterium]|nr:radical SAM protein [Candidatus Dormibacteraeota bacterium]
MRRNDESLRRPGTSPRKPRVDLLLPLVRDAAVLPWRVDASAGADELSAAGVTAGARAAEGQPGTFVLLGGDPLGREDIWDILAAVAQLRPDQLGLWTSGHRLAASVVPRLRAAGVQRVHIPFHCARQDAHDWLVGQAGALKVAHRAIRACVDGELPVVAEIVLTRPTAPHVAETIEVLARLGVRAVCVRRLTEADAPGPQFVTISPRLALLEQSLERAAAVALDRRVRLALRDLPLCVAPRLRPLLATPESERWVAADGHSAPRGEAAPGCPSCPGAPYCAGAPLDYTRRFGWEEFANRADTAARIAESVGAQRDAAPSAPMVFAWDGPSRLACAACAEAPAGSGAAAPESTRVVRARLVAAARHRPAVLRLVGADLLAHPEASKLIYDAVRLFPRVEVAGEASAVAEWSDLDLRRLREVQRFDVALYGPDAETHDAHCGIAGGFAATIRAAQRLRAKANLRVGGYAILHDARALPAYAAAWEDGQLPGEPRFRLAASGGSLDELIDAARALPAGRARSALLAVLPRCLATDAGLVDEAPAATSAPAAQQRIRFGRSLPYDPCGSDPLGAFAPCPTGVGACAVAGCPGRAIGWHSTARSQRWGSSI